MWYRSTARREAERLQLDGWAENLPDGRVEVVACGPSDAVAAFCAWLWTGSPGARVDSVTVEEYAAQPAPGFEVR